MAIIVFAFSQNFVVKIAKWKVWPSKCRSMSRNTIFAMVPFGGKYQSLWKLYFGIFVTLTVPRYSQFKIRDLDNVGKRSYKCDGCEYCCTQSSSVARRELTHISNCPLKCDECVFKCYEGDTLHFATCQRLRSAAHLRPKCKWSLSCSWQICLYFYGTGRRVALVIDFSDKSAIWIRVQRKLILSDFYWFQKSKVSNISNTLLIHAEIWSWDIFW